VAGAMGPPFAQTCESKAPFLLSTAIPDVALGALGFLFLHSSRSSPKRKFEETPKVSRRALLSFCLSVHATPSKHPLVGGSTRRCFLLPSAI